MRRNLEICSLNVVVSVSFRVDYEYNTEKKLSLASTDLCHEQNQIISCIYVFVAAVYVTYEFCNLAVSTLLPNEQGIRK